MSPTNRLTQKSAQNESNILTETAASISLEESIRENSKHRHRQHLF